MESTRSEWLAWRKKGIGSSDAATLHDAPDAYATQLQLWEEKLSTDLSEKPESWAMRKGNEEEIEARKYFSLQYNMENGTDESFPAHWYVLPDLEIIRASVDGRSDDGKVITEFKFQGKEQHLKTSDESLPIRGGRVIEKYWIQCQHGLLASGAEKCVFGSRNPAEPKNVRTVEIFPDEEFLAKHVDVCAKWWKKHILGGVPPAESDRDYVNLKTKGAKGLAKRFTALKAREEKIKAEMEDVRTRLVEMAVETKHPRLLCGAVRFQKSERAGSVEYKNIPAVKAMKKEELEAFRKPPTSYWKVDLA